MNYHDRAHILVWANPSMQWVEFKYVHMDLNAPYHAMLPAEALDYAKNIRSHALACIDPQPFRYEPS